jgi:hypothetical protein
LDRGNRNGFFAQAKAQLFRYIKFFYSGQAPRTGSFSECDSSLIDLAGVDNLPPALSSLASSHREVGDKLQVTEAAISAIREVAALGSTIAAYGKQLGAGQLAEAASSLLKQRGVVEGLLQLEHHKDNSQDNSESEPHPTVLGGLLQEVDKRQARCEPANLK